MLYYPDTGREPIEHEGAFAKGAILVVRKTGEVVRSTGEGTQYCSCASMAQTIIIEYADGACAGIQLDSIHAVTRRIRFRAEENPLRIPWLAHYARRRFEAGQVAACRRRMKSRLAQLMIK